MKFYVNLVHFSVEITDMILKACFAYKLPGTDKYWREEASTR